MKHTLSLIGLICLAWGANLSAANAPRKNWSPPGHKIHAQSLAEETLAKHPELISVTFHGVPPGTDKIYTMFAGTFPERIGNPDDPDDVDIITKGITIVDPRWRRANDAVKKFVMMVPLRDAAGENVGGLVLAYKVPSPVAKDEIEFFAAASAIRDELKGRIPSYAALFQRAD